MRLGKIGKVLDWLGRAKVVFDIVAAVASLKLVKKLLTYVPQISHDWATVIAWGVAALVLFFLVFRFQERMPAQPHVQSPQVAPAATVPTLSTVVPGFPGPNFDAKEFFRTAYYSPLTAEVEKNIRIVAEQNQKNDREGFMAKLVGVGLVGFFHEIAWAYIYKSQLLMLTEMNRRSGWLPAKDAKAYYDSAAIEYPTVYSRYSFDQWLGFLKAQGLILQHPSDMLEITIKGKDFLKYLTHWGHDLNQRKG